MTAAILRLKECQHAGIKEDDCDEMWGNLWWREYTEKYQAPTKTQNGRLIHIYTHTVPEWREWKMDQLQSVNVNYGVLRWQCDNALLLSFTRAVQIYETWDMKQWSVARHVSSLHSPRFVRMMGQINFPSIFPPDCVRDEALTNEPAPSSLHFIFRLGCESPI